MDKTVILENPLRKYLEETQQTPAEFARKSKISPSTIYDICKGRIPNRSTAIQICRHTRGKIKPEDFGWVRSNDESQRFHKNTNRAKIKQSI